MNMQEKQEKALIELARVARALNDNIMLAWSAEKAGEPVVGCVWDARNLVDEIEQVIKDFAPETPALTLLRGGKKC